MKYQAMLYGPPQTQGSKSPPIQNKKTGKYFTIENNKQSRPYRQEWIDVMQEDRPTYPIDEAVEVQMLIYVKRPRSHYNKRGLKPSMPLFARTGKDTDKVARLLGDAMKIAGWVIDDSRIAHWDIWRPYVEEEETERVVVTMRELTDADAERIGIKRAGSLIAFSKESLDRPLLAGL